MKKYFQEIPWNLFEPLTSTNLNPFSSLPEKYYDFFDQMARILLFNKKYLNCLAANCVMFKCSVT